MKILLQSPTLVNPGSSFHKKKKNVLIHNGRIAEIGEKKYAADKVIDARGMFLSAGWLDLGAYVGDPGFEQKEDIRSITEAAAAGGFTGLAVLPNTHPCVQTKNEVSYITGGNSERLVQLFALASVTRNNKGEELTEMIDLHEAGAVAFTDGLKSVWHTDVFLKSLQYLQKFNGLLVDRPEDSWLNLFGQMHEGVISTRLGLKGMPRLAEELALGRNIELLRYAGGRLHCSRLSTARSMELVRDAKKTGLAVSCDIASYQALLDDGSLDEFDTNFKVNPPLREKADQDALIKALKDNTIDVLCSGHLPQEEECKNLEFDMADFGMINLQTFAADLVTLSSKVPMERLIEKITVAPRRLLQLEVPSVEVGERADLTLFDPRRTWTLDEKTNLSKSRNSPKLGRKIKGKAVAVFCNSRYRLDV